MTHRAVVDTNVLVAGLRSRRGSSFRLLQLVGDPRWCPCLSVPVALEYEDVLKREFMRTFISGMEVDLLLDYFFSVADLVAVPFRLRPSLRDPDDDRILELAVRATATIITYNVGDFAGAADHGIPVVPPREFLLQIGELR
jgi:putative PIN family toxin of toxin-antitoxin system